MVFEFMVINQENFCRNFIFYFLSFFIDFILVNSDGKKYASFKTVTLLNGDKLQAQSWFKTEDGFFELENILVENNSTEILIKGRLLELDAECAYLCFSRGFQGETLSTFPIKFVLASGRIFRDQTNFFLLCM